MWLTRLLGLMVLDAADGDAGSGAGGTGVSGQHPASGQGEGGGEGDDQGGSSSGDAGSGAGEGAGAGEGDDPEGLLAAAAAKDKGDDTGEGDDDGKAKRPDYIPEQFWDADKGEVLVEALAKSQSDTRQAYEALKARGEGKAPDKAEDYEFTVPEGYPAPIAGDDPAVKMFREICFDAGVTQEQFKALTGKFLDGMKEIVPEPLDNAAEIAKIGKNGDAMVATVSAWLKGFVENGILTTEEHEEMILMGSTADGVKALNKIREASGGERIIPVTPPAGDGAMSAEELYAAVGSEKYQNDAAYRAKITKEFAKVFGEEPSGESPRGLGLPRSSSLTSPNQSA